MIHLNWTKYIKLFSLFFFCFFSSIRKLNAFSEIFFAAVLIAIILNLKKNKNLKEVFQKNEDFAFCKSDLKFSNIFFSVYDLTDQGIDF